MVGRPGRLLAIRPEHVNWYVRGAPGRQPSIEVMSSSEKRGKEGGGQQDGRWAGRYVGGGYGRVG